MRLLPQKQVKQQLDASHELVTQKGYKLAKAVDEMSKKLVNLRKEYEEQKTNLDRHLVTQIGTLTETRDKLLIQIRELEETRTKERQPVTLLLEEARNRYNQAGSQLLVVQEKEKALEERERVLSGKALLLMEKEAELAGLETELKERQQTLQFQYEFIKDANEKFTGQMQGHFSLIKKQEEQVLQARKENTEQAIANDILRKELENEQNRLKREEYGLRDRYGALQKAEQEIYGRRS